MCLANLVNYDLANCVSEKFSPAYSHINFLLLLHHCIYYIFNAEKKLVRTAPNFSFIFLLIFASCRT